MRRSKRRIFQREWLSLQRRGAVGGAASCPGGSEPERLPGGLTRRRHMVLGLASVGAGAALLQCEQMLRKMPVPRDSATQQHQPLDAAKPGQWCPLESHQLPSVLRAHPLRVTERPVLRRLRTRGAQGVRQHARVGMRVPLTIEADVVQHEAVGEGRSV